MSPRFVIPGGREGEDDADVQDGETVDVGGGIALATILDRRAPAAHKPKAVSPG
jgi:hypothetical protein